MSKFLVLYRSNVSAADQMSSGTPEQMKTVMDAWMKWGEQAGSALTDWGAPLGEARTVGDGVAKSAGYIGGYSIVEAESIDAATKLLDNHPHLTMPDGAAIEVHELMPMPGA